MPGALLTEWGDGVEGPRAARNDSEGFSVEQGQKGGPMTILWIIVVVVLVLALLGFLGFR